MTTNLAFPYDCVCYVTDVINGVAYRASGVIIGPHTILTAAHVVWDSGSDQSATSIRVYPGYYPGDTTYATGATIHYNAVDDTGGQIYQDQSQSDFAIIDVSQDLSAYGSFGILTDYSGGAASITGYPATNGRTQQNVSGTVTQDGHYSLLDYGSSFDVNPGSSGGPIWVNEGTDSDPLPYVVGLVSTSSWGAQITSADLTEIETWMAQDGYSLSGEYIPASNDGNLIWESSTGLVSLWEFNGTVAPSGFSLPSAVGWQIDDTGDFNGDGLTDLVLRNTTSGMVDIWTDTNGFMVAADVVQVTLDWNIMGTGDFNGDGKSDILWRNEQNGYVSIWLMNGDQVTSTWNPGAVGLEWHIVGDGDYNGDGRADILWRNANSGEVDIWTMNPSTGLASGTKVATLGLEWQVIGQGDFNGDGKTDILWRDTSDGQIVIWEMNGAQVQASQAIANLGPQWKVAEVTDVNHDGKADIVWLDSGSGQVVVWEMNGFNVQQSAAIGNVTAAWTPINHHFDWI